MPASDVPGEKAWPTQPFPTRPRPLVPEQFSVSEIFGVSAAGRAWCHARLDDARSTGIFTPPSLQGTLIYPGNIGGSNWSGLTVDPVRHLAFVPSNRMITRVDLIPRAQLRDLVVGGDRFE